MEPTTFDRLALSATWMVPLATALMLAAVHRTKVHTIRRLSLAAAVVDLALVVYLAVRFTLAPPLAEAGSTRTALAFGTELPWFKSIGASYLVGVDGISLLLMLLAAVIVLCGTLASFTMTNRVKDFFVLLQVLAAGTFGSFMSFDLFTFFIFSELTIIPTYLLIGIHGSGQRTYAAMKLTLLLVLGSALVLLGFLGVYFESGAHTFNLLDLAEVRFDPAFQHWAFPVMFLGFALLGNLFPFHIWSPDGHAAAPTAVSMFLAGVHMKLGSYGCLRMAMYLLPEGSREWLWVFLCLAVAGTLWGAFVAVRQRDLKYMNAYASVSHCALVILGLGALTAVAVRGAVLQMVAHGLITAAFFSLIGMIYERTHTRDIPSMGGLMRVMPFLGVSLVVTSLAAVGLPGLAGFVAELNIFLGGLAAESPWIKGGTALCILSIVLAAVYMLRAVNAVLHGPLPAPLQSGTHGSAAELRDANLCEKFAVTALLTAILFMGLFPGWMVNMVDQALNPILANLNR